MRRTGRTILSEFVQVDFNYGGATASIRLYSKYSRITGDSGDNKSEFVETVNNCIINEDPDFSYSVSNGFDIVCVLFNTDVRKLLDSKDTIFLLDDFAVRRASLVNALLNTNNLFIFVCRSTSICGAVPLIGTYNIHVTDNWFTFSNVTLPTYVGSTSIDSIVVESAKDRSEHALLSVYRDDIIPAEGQGNVLDTLRKTCGVKLVLLDLGNIGDILPGLSDYVSENNDVYFYNYQAFEELLYKSPLLSHLVKDSVYNVFADISLEKYYEHVLAECTKNTEFAYNHKHPVLAAPYLDKANFKKIFDSDVGRALIPLLSSGTEQFDAVAYLQNKAGNKFKYFTQIQIDNCQTQEDCDQLLQSLRWLD